MLTRLVVDLYGWIIEISLWFILLVSAVAGFHSIVPILKSAGWIEGEIRTATARHNVFLKELGLPPLPLGDSD
ncbi:MAG: hypothetical protein ABI728_00045 [Betaproteobacteria bacterium]